MEIGEDIVIAAKTGIAGSTKIGRDCMIGGQCGFGGISKLEIMCVGAQSGIITNIVSGRHVQGTLAIDVNQFYVPVSYTPDYLKWTCKSIDYKKKYQY